jgi:hypothetical protein
LVEDGRLDSVLDELAEAVRNRRRILWERGREEEAQQAKEAGLNRKGARVELHGLRPKYLNHITGTVDSDGPFTYRKGQPMIPVYLDYAPVGSKRMWSRHITVPLNCLRPTKVAAPKEAGNRQTLAVVR